MACGQVQNDLSRTTQPTGVIVIEFARDPRVAIRRFPDKRRVVWRKANSSISQSISIAMAHDGAAIASPMKRASFGLGG